MQLRRRCVACAVGVFVATPLATGAQAARHLRLKPADAALDEEFTTITSVRELSDGRVLVSDPRDGRVVVADFKTGAVTRVGRKGAGPGEYQIAAQVRAIGGDSSILMDMASRRWLVFDGAAIVQTLSANTPIILAVRGVARGADRLGRVMTVAAPQSFDPEHPKPGVVNRGIGDSDYVVMGSRATGKLDTIARIRSAVTRQTVTTDAAAKIRSVSIVRPPLSTGEEAVLATDGWVAIVRLDPYRVDWVSPDGRLTKGAPIPSPVIRVTPAERDAYIARQAAARGANPQNLPPGLQQQLDAMKDQFPDVFPPFAQGSLIAGDNGTLWLKKQFSKDFEDPRYEIVDRRGLLLGTVALAKGERPIAVTARYVYVVWKDADDIERIRRHPNSLVSITTP